MPATLQEAAGEEDLAAAQQLLDVFDQVDEDGNYLFNDEDVRLALPLLILNSGMEPDDLGPAVHALLGEFAAVAGLDLDAPPEELNAQVAAFYAEYPPPEALMAALQEVLEGVSAGALDVASSAAQKLLGQDKFLKPVGSEGRKEGSIRGGAAGRLDLLAASEAGQKKKKK